MDLTNDQRGWILTFASAVTCILGSLVICADKVWNRLFPKHAFDFQNSNGVLIASLSMSSGVLIVTAFYKLLPEAFDYFDKSPELGAAESWQHKCALFAVYFLGVGLCASINAVIHALTSQSVVHCAHDVDNAHGNDNDEEEGHHHHHRREDDESTPLLDSNRRRSILDITNQRIRGKQTIGKCMGYSSIDECIVIKDPRSGQQLEVEASPDTQVHIAPATTNRNEGHGHEGHKQDHHHHVSTRYTHMFSIGLQTALAISVHKVPEGFLTFATTHGNPELGFSVFLALAIHNFSEGFTIAFPLYLALQNRGMAIAASVVLGGLSQPVGAVLAWLMFRSKFTDRFNLTFGIIVAITSGFMTLIGFQMYGASVAYGGKQSTTLAFVFVGVAVIALSTVLT